MVLKVKEALPVKLGRQERMERMVSRETLVKTAFQERMAKMDCLEKTEQTAKMVLMESMDSRAGLVLQARPEIPALQEVSFSPVFWTLYIPSFLKLPDFVLTLRSAW
jgi:hypothetical protein